MQRWADFILAFAALLLLAPPLAVIALCVAIFMGRPIFFRQDRSGLGGVPFQLIKFRSMRSDRDRLGQLLPDHLRTTRLGRVLRRTRLDELPELWNILRGDMALVGPRPLLPDTIADLGAAGVLRSSVRPGLTGLAQISGNTLLPPGDKIALDLFYVRERMPGLDVRILLRTPFMMILGERIDRDLLEEAYARNSGGIR